MKRLVLDRISACWFSICCWTGDGSKAGAAPLAGGSVAPGRGPGDVHAANAMRTAIAGNPFRANLLMVTHGSGMPVLSRSAPWRASTLKFARNGM
jgi:hypothetical protein